ncbi:MAG: SAM-dependent methyltransferase [Bacteroidetes bacterium]|nr:MAG: SAM-dependent methyltransferase [Bacteroidota bacterium]
MIKIITFAVRYFRYLIKSKHYKGHGIHSPFLYQFTREVIFSNQDNPHFSKIESIRKELENDKTLIQINDYGAGSRVFKNRKRRISDIAKVSSTNKKYGKMLYRMVEYFDVKNILELGTSLGIGTMYLAYSQKAKVCTIEGDLSIYEKAKSIFEQAELSNITSIKGEFSSKLPEVLNKVHELDLVYFDGNHKMQATLNYFEQCLTKITNHSVFVFDDIHWSADMEYAWEKIKLHPKTMVTVDLFQMGIVFFRKELSKEHFVIKYL